MRLMTHPAPPCAWETGTPLLLFATSTRSAAAPRVFVGLLRRPSFARPTDPSHSAWGTSFCTAAESEGIAARMACSPSRVREAASTRLSIISGALSRGTIANAQRRLFRSVPKRQILAVPRACPRAASAALENSSLIPVACAASRHTGAGIPFEAMR
jgi:hypothetical protein